ncbi:MAG: type III pantothenate kinase [Candidatus Binatia bacterium]|nr:MAG: type III pantothenate kinase [Candidatus Binatia bacterium]
MTDRWFLAIDVSNTQTALGAFEGETLRHHWLLQTDPGRTADEYGVLVRSLLERAGSPAIGAVAVASSVPAMLPIVETLSRELLGCEPLVVGPGVRTGMPILYDKPQEVGADRIVNAVAAYARTHRTTIVVDLSTATIFDFISNRGEYVGGVIAPGLGIASDALFERTARLFRVELRRPKHVIGRNTVHAIQSGLVYGYVALVDGIVQRMQEEARETAYVLATGTYAELIAPESEAIDDVDPFLTLQGLRLLYERNKEKG